MGVLYGKQANHMYFVNPENLMTVTSLDMETINNSEIQHFNQSWCSRMAKDCETLVVWVCCCPCLEYWGICWKHTIAASRIFNGGLSFLLSSPPLHSYLLLIIVKRVWWWLGLTNKMMEWDVCKWGTNHASLSPVMIIIIFLMLYNVSNLHS